MVLSGHRMLLRRSKHTELDECRPGSPVIEPRITRYPVIEYLRNSTPAGISQGEGRGICAVLVISLLGR